jgi:hypothetical protein
MRRVFRILISIAIALAAAACVTAIRHNQDMAAIEAVHFAQLALLNRDYSRARAQLALGRLNKSSAKQFQDRLEGIHFRGWPTSVTADRFEPMPGQRSIRIYLTGKSADENFYYVFVMEADADSGYHVSDLYRVKDQIPTSGLMKPLPVERATH